MYPESTSHIMRECMGTVKPQIAILMAVYEPKLDWLREQLLSLERQTYPNLRLYVRDDFSTTVPFEEICACVAECVQSFPFEIQRNEKNLGSNKTFERLTEEAEGEYFAYCDQDDVWLPDKLTILQQTAERERALLVCSDMTIIDGEGKQATSSITKVRRHHKFRSGCGLASGLLTTNFVTGCTTLIRRKTAKDALPFCPYMFHDHYLALFAAIKGKIVSVPQTLIRYRIHGGNQTGLMAGVRDRESYIEVYIRNILRRLVWLQDNLHGLSAELREAIACRLQWVRARERNMTGRGGKRVIWKYRRLGLRASFFELAAPLLPDKVFMQVINLARSNKL